MRAVPAGFNGPTTLYAPIDTVEVQTAREMLLHGFAVGARWSVAPGMEVWYKRLCTLTITAVQKLIMCVRKSVSTPTNELSLKKGKGRNTGRAESSSAVACLHALTSTDIFLVFLFDILARASHPSLLPVLALLKVPSLYMACLFDGNTSLSVVYTVPAPRSLHNLNIRSSSLMKASAESTRTIFLSSWCTVSSSTRRVNGSAMQR